MGCDGGTIPKRDELVRTKKNPEQKDKTADLVARWKHCSLSQEALQHPIMSCELGRLYNKESVLEFLLDRSKFEGNFDHIRVYKDLKELKVTENPAFKAGSEKGDSYIDMQKSAFICPVTGLEMNGKYRFCYLWGCGCIISDKALKEVPSDICHKCGQAYSPDDIIILNGADEEVQLMREKMFQRREKAKLEKKTKKAEKKRTAETEQPTSSKIVRFHDSQNGIKVNNASGSKRKLPAEHSYASKLLKDDSSETHVKTIQKNPNASAAFKSLFTTSEAAKNQQKAHWVTYNPCFY